LAIGVNYSSKHFVDPQTATSIAATLASVGLDGKRLHLELTESALLEDPDTAIGILTELSEHGIEIVLNDFGTGFSSLSYLQRLPVSALKIDRSFVKALTTSTSNADIVRSIIGLAGNLGFGVIAEGVESRQQLQHLMQMGCDEAQGFLLGHPVDAEGASALLQEQAESKDGIWVSLGEDPPAMASTGGRPNIDVVSLRSGGSKR
jgi:Amt family ammonium transporter